MSAHLLELGRLYQHALEAYRQTPGEVEAAMEVNRAHAALSTEWLRHTVEGKPVRRPGRLARIRRLLLGQ